MLVRRGSDGDPAGPQSHMTAWKVPWQRTVDLVHALVKVVAIISRIYFEFTGQPVASHYSISFLPPFPLLLCRRNAFLQ